MENRSRLILIVVCILIFIFFRAVPFLKTDTEKIRQIIYSAKVATEKEDLFKCISYISLDYKDRDGNDRPSLFILGKNVFQNYDDIFIIIEDLKIDVADNKQPIAHLIVSGQGRRQTGDKFQFVIDKERVKFDVVFRREGSSFKVIELKFIEPDNFLKLLKGL